MTRETQPVVDELLNPVTDDEGNPVRAGEWEYVDFPLRGGDWWNTPNPDPPTDGNAEPDYLLAAQANELREALRRRMVTHGVALTDLPAEVAIGNRPDYHWVEDMRTAIEGCVTSGKFYGWNYGPEAWAGVAAFLTAVHALTGASSSLNQAADEWGLIDDDADPANFVYGQKQGAGHEQLDRIWSIRIANFAAATDATGWAYFKLVDSRPGGKWRWEQYNDAARLVLKAFSTDFEEAFSGVVAFGTGSIETVRPTGGYATTSSVKAQLPDKRVMWAAHLNELYYAIEVLNFVKVTQTPSYVTGTVQGEGGSAGTATEANIPLAYANGWADFYPRPASVLLGNGVAAFSSLYADGGNFTYEVSEERCTDTYFLHPGGYPYPAARVLLPIFHSSDDPTMGSPLSWSATAWRNAEGADDPKVYGTGTTVGDSKTFSGWLGHWADADTGDKLHCSHRFSGIEVNEFGDNFQVHNYQRVGGMTDIPYVFQTFMYGGYRNLEWEPEASNDVNLT